MTPENVSPVEPQPPRMSEFSRMIGVYFEPTKTFEDVARRPSFLAPLLLTIGAALVYMVLFTQHVGWERTIRHQQETSTRPLAGFTAQSAIASGNARPRADLELTATR